MTPCRSVGAPRSFALAVVVAAALAIVYVALVPTLERRLVNAKVAQLRSAAPGLRTQLAEADLTSVDFVTNAAVSANARVEIGRASCRERVWLWGGEDSGEEARER